MGIYCNTDQCSNPSIESKLSKIYTHARKYYIHQSKEVKTKIGLRTPIIWQWSILDIVNLSFVLHDDGIYHELWDNFPCPATTKKSLWTMNQFLVTNKSQVGELCVKMSGNKRYWFIQIHLDIPYCAAIEQESTQWCKLDAAPFWHIMAYLWRCNIL